MPKEYITTDHDQRQQEELGGRQTAVKVTWDRVGYVQIASVLRGGVEGMPPGTTGPVDGYIDEGWFIDMDRASLNRLIRVLRRARDQAYGADA